MVQADMVKNYLKGNSSSQKTLLCVLERAVQARHSPQLGQIVCSSVRWLKIRSRAANCKIPIFLSYASLKNRTPQHFYLPSPPMDSVTLLRNTHIFVQLILLNIPDGDLSSSPSCDTNLLCGFGFNLSVLQFPSLYRGNRTDNIYPVGRCCSTILEGHVMHLFTCKKIFRS